MPSIDTLESFIDAARFNDVECLQETPVESWPELALLPGKGGNTALHMVSGNGHAALLTTLLKEGNVDVKNDSGSTPLHWGALNGHLEVVQILLSAGANPTLLNDSGLSPISMAESREHLDVVQEMLKSPLCEVDMDDDEELVLTDKDLPNLE